MWNLPIDKIEHCLTGDGGIPRIAIETGTCRGNGTRWLARRFERVVTIELSEMLYRQSRASLAGVGFEHVEFHQGDSAALLPSVLATIEPAQPVFIFLDAHWSGDSTVDWKKAAWKGYGIDTAHLGGANVTPRGPEQCPLERELTAIVKHCRGPAHLLIDDLKCLPLVGNGLKDHEFPGEDWSHLSRDLLLSIVKPRLRNIREFTNPSQWFLSLNSIEN